MTHLLVNRYPRVLYDDNSSFTEYSEELRDWTTGTMGVELVPSEDYIYVGAPHTFAARFLLMDGLNVNAVSSALTVEYYYGSDNWRSVKNLRDETRSGSATCAKSGFIMWDLPDDWVKNQVNSTPELGYNETAGDGRGYYWIRISASAQFTAGTALKWLGLIWTHEDYMEIIWPEFNDSKYLPTGQTDWYQLIEMSTGDVADDLNISNLIDYELQAKDVSELAKLTAYKTLINILIPMVSSETLQKQKSEYEKIYTKLLGKRLKGIDVNQDEKLTPNEDAPFSNTLLRRS